MRTEGACRRGFVSLLVLVLLGSCDEAPSDVRLGLRIQNGHAIMLFVTCSPNEGISELTLSRVEDGDVLWEIMSSVPRDINRIQIGQVPDGFEELTSFSGLPEGEAMTLRLVNGDGHRFYNGFELDELAEEDVFARNTHFSDETEYERDAQAAC